MSRAIAFLHRSLFGDGTGSLVVDGPMRGQTRPPHRVSINVLVIAMIVALVTPAVAFLAMVVQQHEKEHQHQVDEVGERTAQEITDRLEQEFQTSKTILAVFGTSGWLETGELQRLHSRARRTLAGSGRHLIVLDENMNQLLNTRVDFGTRLPRTSDPASALKVIDNGRPAVSDVFVGGVAEVPVFNVLRPVTLPESKGVMILTRDAASLVSLLSSDATSDPWRYAVLDGAGQLVSKEVPADGATEVVPTACFQDAANFRPRRVADPTRYVFLQTVGGSRWSVCVWARVDKLAETTRIHWSELYPVTLIWIVVALAAATLIGSIISRSIANTARLAETLGSGQTAPPLPSLIAEIADVRRTLAEAAGERLRNEQRLELLMRELAHRAKNQIALTSSLLQLCSRTASSASDLKEDVMGRLLALSRSIDLVTADASDRASLADLIRAQLHPFLSAGEHRLELQGDDLLLSGSAAQSLSLVLHEKATNASKHGAWAQPGGKVAISWYIADGELVLDWSESGAASGAPEHRGFGTDLVDTLVEKVLKGKIHRRFGELGLSCRIVLPLEAIRHAT